MVRVPTGPLDTLVKRYDPGQTPLFVGTCGFEDRCIAVPLFLVQKLRRRVQFKFVQLRPVEDAFPDYCEVVRERTLEKRKSIERKVKDPVFIEADLLANQDELLEVARALVGDGTATSVILDISCLPKRFYCFLVAFLARQESVEHLLVTYTPVPLGGYATGRPLAEDPLPPSFLPGFTAPLPPKAGDVVLSIGFEALGGAQVLEDFLAEEGGLRILLPFPPYAEALKRAWDTLRFILRDQSEAIRQENVKIVSALDVERAMDIFQVWYDATSPSNSGLVFAPFGPKPHTLAMSLFCQFRQDTGMIYTQPKAYYPEYSRGWVAPTIGYVVKWNGIRCYERQ